MSSLSFFLVRRRRRKFSFLSPQLAVAAVPVLPYARGVAAALGIDPERVIAWCRENMANYKVPRRVAVVDELPVNASGKVLKYVLRERALEMPAE